MSSYVYRPLRGPDDLRLLKLLPGSLDDDIQFCLFHAPLALPAEDSSTTADKIDLEQKVQNALPPHWIARRTLEGDTLFCYNPPDATEHVPRWSHPNEHFDQSLLNQHSNVIDSSSLPYEALSYTWGSLDTPITAIVHSDPQESAGRGKPPATLQLGRNLSDALRYLRYTNSARVLWVDAICINQRDKSERNEQVKRMGDIYKFAERVVVWLGEESSGSKLAMSTLAFLGSQVELTQDYRRTASPGCQEPLWNLSTHPIPYESNVWQAIFELIGRPWFSRLWILQEIQLANRRAILLCGREEIEWRLFRRAISTLNDKAQGPFQGLRDRMGPINSMCWVRKSISMIALLNMARQRKCSENHDKVYAILGLLSSEAASQITPDYNLSFESVFTDVQLVYINTYRRLDLIQRCSNREYLPNLPSWVPNWTGKATGYPIYGQGFRAASLSVPHIHHKTPTTLDAIGVHLTTVSTVDSPEVDSLFQIFAILRTFGLEKLKQSLYPVGGTIFSAYAWTLAYGQLQERFNPANFFPVLNEWESFMEQAIQNPDANEPIKQAFFWHWVQTYSKGRRMVKTSDGYIGMAMGDVLPGDRVCILLGCDMPMLLRKTSSSEYQVVGECYMHGFMDGEGLLGPLPESWIVQAGPGAEGLWKASFLNQSTKVVTDEDPRLGVLSDEWEVMSSSQVEDSNKPPKFRAKSTGEVVDSDPRLLPQALQARGTSIESFSLV